MTRCACRLPILLSAILLASAAPSTADELIWASGKAVGADGKPLKGAIVVVYDDKERIVDYAYTDEKGEYALAIPENVLNLETKKSGGFLASVAGKVKRFVNAQATGLAQGAKTTILALTTTQAGTLTAPVAKAALDTGSRVAGRVERQLNPKEKEKAAEDALKRSLKSPGVVYLRASAPGVTDFGGISRIYWMQRESFKNEDREEVVYSAWLEPINFTSSGSGKPSSSGTDYLKLFSVKLEPGLAPPGGKFNIAATLALPPEPSVNLIVIARNHAGQIWELQRGQNNVWSAEITVDEKFPQGDQIVSVLAYPAGDRPGRRPNAERAIEGAGLWDVTKDFVPNPLLCASRNRADLKITILPKKESLK